MRATLLVGSAVVLVVLCMITRSVASAQPAFKHSKVEFAIDLPNAYNTANHQHEGDLFVYFYRSGDSLHAKVDSLVFSDERLSRYISENFGALAVDVDTEIGKQVFDVIDPGHAYQVPFVAVVSKRYLNTMLSYGWHHVSPWLDDYGLDTNGQRWLMLVSMKEFGHRPSMPGDEDWGRWSARVQELISAFGPGE